MANSMFGFPNYADSTFNTVVFSGGDWTSGDGSIANLIDARLDKAAITDGVTTTATQFEIDLGSLREIRMVAIPSHNMSLDALWKVRGTLNPKWATAVVGSNGSASDTTVDIKNNGSASITIEDGDVFTIGGYSYECASTQAIAPAATETISLESAPANDTLFSSLQADVSVDDVVDCNSGDYTTTQYDSDWVEAFQVVYPYGTKPWGHPSAWTGKITEEERTKYKHPLILTFNTKVARFWKIEFDDDTSTLSGLRFSRFFIAPAYQPTLNPVYGAEFAYQNETVVEKSLDGVESFDRKQPFRTLGFTISLLENDEALAASLEMQRDAGSDKQIFFVFDPDDTLHMNRRAFTSRLQRIDPLIYSSFDRMTFAGEVREIQGGLLT